MLKDNGIDAAVIDVHTLKPLDEELLTAEAKKTGAFVIAEEHLVFGGLGSAVSQLISQRQPVPMEFVGIQDTYAESGKAEELMEKYGLTSKNIVRLAQKVISRKSK